MKKIISAILVLVLAVVALVGCFDNTQNTPSAGSGSQNTQPNKPNTKPEDSNKEDTKPAPENSISFAEFLKGYKNKALQLVHEFISPSVTNGREVKNETISISANANDELSQVDLLCTYSLGGTDRVMEYASVTLTNPVDLDKIADGSVTSADISFEVKSKTVLAFNAKTVAENQDVAKAVYKVAKLSDYSGTMLYSEVECSQARTRAFDLVELTDNGAKVRNITVANANNDSTLLSDLSNTIKAKDKGVTATYKMSGETIVTSNYVLEDFGSILDPDKQINSITDLVTNYSSEVASALEANFLDQIGKTLYGKTGFDSNKLVSTSWDIGTSNTISEIKLISTYQDSSLGQSISVGTIKLANPISVKNITKENINSIWASNVSSSTYTRDYSFGCVTAEQGTRDSLVNAIFEAKGIEATEGATRLFVYNGAFLNQVNGKYYNEVAHFTLVEISANQIIEFSIKIAVDQYGGVVDKLTDTEFAQILQDSTRYEFLNNFDKSCSYSSNQVKK